MTKKYEGLINIISSIYDAAVNPDAWHTIGELLRQRYHTVYSGLYVINTMTNELAHSKIVGVDDAFESLYAQHYCYMDPYRQAEQFIASNPHIPLTDQRMDDVFFSIEKNHKKYPYFAEYWHKFDCKNAIGTMIDMPDNLRAGICSPRNSSIGPYTQLERYEFELIRKSFNQSMLTSQKLQQIGLQSPELETTINLLNKPVFIVDQYAKILYSNDHGKQQLNTKSIVKEINGNLEPVFKQMRSSFISSISRVCNESITDDKSLSRKTQLGPVEILILPVQKNAINDLFYFPKALVIINIDSLSSIKIIKKLYHLTHAEFEVLKLIINGNSIKKMTQIRNTSKDTIKSQLKSIYRKTGKKDMESIRSLIK